uniref:Translocon-associated protein subunit gamma n=1 Tax=Vannella robusta TaxID=1487602 RepID=A0A7S4M5Y2_9EUKA|eukprot:CAMPEP_0206195132 /NCGR_PEP_ID=MMETSP0166-20121206/7648_1 /ASSEMBLY_ACC=CAM_ASM_000260 /TAXON_ID=95228 /ORGANISM="Vannella robusta, Strain DIVA3 518/3/11/1/6" /LENGTH=174 /DNA_ID=CAMNT_0053612313 /DNA_START=14 /DNA_END=538 /DNA_ORIENTATION=+
MPANDQFTFVDDNKPSFGERIWYFLNALLVVAPPVYLYHSVFGIDIEEMYWLYASVSILAAVILSTAHNNVAYWLRSRLEGHRDETVTHNMVAAANEGKKHKEKVQVEKKAQKKHTRSESYSFAILYNNFFFLFVFFVVGFYFFPNFPPVYNYAFSVLGSALLVSFVSHQSVKH